MRIVPDENAAVQPEQRFGKWLIVGSPFYSVTGNQGRRLQLVVAQCECGTMAAVCAQSIARGKSGSCGCDAHQKTADRNYRHGGSGTRLHNIWNGMKSRCLCEKCEAYKDYGGRGIGIRDEWRDDFAAFREWAYASGYADHLTIDRRDNDEGYSPENCRWVTFDIQANNTRKNRRFTAFGESKTVPEWSRDDRCNVNSSTLWARLTRGWNVELAIRQPLLPNDVTRQRFNRNGNRHE